MVSIGLLVLRVVVGLTVAGHGAEELFGWFGGPGSPAFVAGSPRCISGRRAPGRSAPPWPSSSGSLTGPGAISLDQALRVSLPEPGTWIAMAVLVLLRVASALTSTRVRQVAPGQAAA